MDTVEASETEYVRQVLGLDWMMRPAALAAVGLLPDVLKKPGFRILDLGAGSGVWSFQLLDSDKSATATLVDWAGVLNIARAKASERGIAERVNFISGNYHEVDFQGTYDQVILGNITHLESPNQLFALLKRAKAALKADGEIVIFDVFDSQPKGQLAFALYSLGLGLRSQLQFGESC